MAAAFLVAIAILAILLGLALGYRQCETSGGQYMRGLFWMECVRR
jgi:hypothetical protein